MNRTYKYTLLTVFLALIFAVGSMAGMKFILEEREKQILSESGTVVMEAPVRAWQESKTDENEGCTLTVNQIGNAIDNWNNRRWELIHSPVEGQCSMEQAIEEGKGWLASMKKSGMVEEETALESEIYSVSADLKLGKQGGQTWGQMEPYYSFWTVQLTNHQMSATVYVNAVTGKVWGAEIILYEGIPSKMPIESMYLFAELTGIENTGSEEPKVSANGTGAVMTLNEGIEAQMYFSVAEPDPKIVDYGQLSIFQETYAVISYQLAAE